MVVKVEVKELLNSLKWILNQDALMADTEFSNNMLSLVEIVCVQNEEINDLKKQIVLLTKKMNAISIYCHSENKSIGNSTIDSDYEFSDLALNTGVQLVHNENATLFSRKIYLNGIYEGSIHYGAKFLSEDSLVNEANVINLIISASNRRV